MVSFCPEVDSHAYCISHSLAFLHIYRVELHRLAERDIGQKWRRGVGGLKKKKWKEERARDVSVFGQKPWPSRRTFIAPMGVKVSEETLTQEIIIHLTEGNNSASGEQPSSGALSPRSDFSESDNLWTHCLPVHSLGRRGERKVSSQGC